MKNVNRIFVIISTLLQYDLHLLPLVPRRLRISFQVLRCFMPHRWQKKPGTAATKMRQALEQLGPLWVKFGQLLSTRRDLLPEEFANELSKLQDQATPFSSLLAIQMIERALKKPIAECFQTFNPTPLAAASIAQVHEAILFSNEAVVVKILRPHIHADVRSDCRLLQVMARLCVRFWPALAPLKLREVVQEIKHTLELELDLRYEAANASLLAHHFERSPLLKVPKVYWDYSTSDILVTEHIFGIPIHQIQHLKDTGVNLKRLAERGVEIFFTQVFQNRFFHADMHAGNIFVVGSPDNPQYAAIDFGIMGQISSSDQRYLALNFLAFFQRDYARIAACHIESGWVPANTKAADLEAAFRTILEPIYAKPLKDISFGHLLLQLLQIGKKYHMTVQPQLLLLHKTLLAIEGLGRQLYPELDLWQTAKPFLERWGKQHFGFKNTIRQLRKQWPFYQARLPELFEALLKK